MVRTTQLVLNKIHLKEKEEEEEEEEEEIEINK